VFGRWIRYDSHPERATARQWPHVAAAGTCRIGQPYGYRHKGAGGKLPPMCGRFWIPHKAIDNSLRGLPADLQDKAREAIA
jgi:hypothetical protein